MPLQHNQQQPTDLTPPKDRLTFRSFSISPGRVRDDNKSKTRQCNALDSTSSSKVNGCSEHQFGRMHSAIFGLDWACGRTCNVEKGHGPLHRPAFPRGIKSSCGRPGACQSKPIWIKAKCWIQVSVWTRREAFRNASKLPYLRKARASALRCMQLPAVCSARRNHGKNKMNAKCLLQIICIQSAKENFCELLE